MAFQGWLGQRDRLRRSCGFIINEQMSWAKVYIAYEARRATTSAVVKPASLKRARMLSTVSANGTVSGIGEQQSVETNQKALRRSDRRPELSLRDDRKRIPIEEHQGSY